MVTVIVTERSCCTDYISSRVWNSGGMVQILLECGSDIFVLIDHISEEFMTTILRNCNSHYFIVCYTHCNSIYSRYFLFGFKPNSIAIKNNFLFCQLAIAFFYFQEKYTSRLHIQMTDFIYQGAEARVYTTTYLGKAAVLKERLSKSYRVKELDKKINKQRLLQEARCIVKCRRAGVATPR